MAEKINAHYQELLKHEENPTLLVVCVLKGAFMFFTDLIRFFDFKVE
jgi:hypoxanthine-guanine phosphoribosyltransferase